MAQLAREPHDFLGNDSPKEGTHRRYLAVPKCETLGDQFPLIVVLPVDDQKLKYLLVRHEELDQEVYVLGHPDTLWSKSIWRKS